jgi:hypothetical protein
MGSSEDCVRTRSEISVQPEKRITFAHLATPQGLDAHNPWVTSVGLFMPFKNSIRLITPLSQITRD